MNGDQGDHWVQYTVELNTREMQFIQPVSLIIRATRGNGYAGDIAIDDLYIATESLCPVEGL